MFHGWASYFPESQLFCHVQIIGQSAALSKQFDFLALQAYMYGHDSTRKDQTPQ
jgi:hypothetical protein